MAVRFVLAVCALALVVACEGTEPSFTPNSGNIVGTINGSTFAGVGTRAVRSGELITLSVANSEIPCDGEPRPDDGLLRVDISLPDGVRMEGQYALDVSPAGVRPALGASGVTRSPDGAPIQWSAVASSGFLAILSGAPEFHVSVEVNEPDVSLSGSFRAELCPR